MLFTIENQQKKISRYTFWHVYSPLNSVNLSSLTEVTLLLISKPTIPEKFICLPTGSKNVGNEKVWTAAIKSWVSAKGTVSQNFWKKGVNGIIFFTWNGKDTQNLKKFCIEFFHLYHKIDPLVCWTCIVNIYLPSSFVYGHD